MAAFTPGNIVIVRVGTGSAALSSAAQAVFLDEYTTGGTLVQSVALPATANTGATGNDALTISGTAGSEGQISDSADGKSVLLAGYNVSAGTASVAGTSTAGPANQRVIGVVNAAGNVDTSTNVGTFDSANNARSAASADGSNLYIGTPSGIAYTTDGSTATPTANAASGPTTIDATNTRQTEVVTFNGSTQLYYSTSSGGTGATGIYTLGGVPTTTQSTSTTTDAGTLLAASPSPYGFFVANLGTAAGAQPDTLYVVDTTNGIEKFTFNGSTYTAAGAINTATTLSGGSVNLTGGTAAATQLFGITGIVTAGTNGGSATATLFVTTGSGLYKLTDSGTGTLAGPATQIAAAATNEGFRGDAVAPTVCYCTGTRIRVARGGREQDVAVEALRVGDLAVTASGEHRPVRWIGRRTSDPRRHPRPHEAQPVRIAADAFGRGRPARDLRVSPNHAICLDLMGEVLVPAIALVNGATIRQEEVDRVTYWHVELDSHDILLAENMPAESYIDCGNRGFFADGAVVDLAAGPDGPAATTADYCRPFHGDGAFVEVARTQLHRRLSGLGWRLDQREPWDGVALVVGGRTVLPDARGLSASFALPAAALAGAQDAWLTGPTARPSEVGDSRDTRALGLCLAAMVLDDGLGDPRAVALDDPRLAEGFHGHEGTHRWTAGEARLPAALLAGAAGTVVLRLDLYAPPVARWTAPDATDALAGNRTALPAPRLVG